MSAARRPPLKQAQSITSLLGEMLKKPGIGEQITRHQAWLIWDQIVGKQIAARARPLRLRQGTLEIQVDHPVWMQQLQMMKTQILDKINERVPAAGITDLYLRKAHYPGAAARKTPPAKKSQEWQTIELSAAESGRIDSLLEQIADPELKEELRRLFSMQMKLQKERSS